MELNIEKFNPTKELRTNELRKFRVEVYNSGSLFTFVDLLAKNKEDAEKLAKAKMGNPLTFKVKKF